MINPGSLVGGCHPDPLFSEILNDGLVGVDDAECGQMRTTTSAYTLDAVAVKAGNDTYPSRKPDEVQNLEGGVET